MKRKSWLASLTVVLMLGTTLLGCDSSGKGNTESDSSKPPTVQEPVKIQVWERLAGAYLTTMKKLVDQFNQENPKISVELVPIAPGDYTAALQAGIAGNNLPDIFMNGSIPLQQLVQLNLVHDLSDLITASKRSEFVPGTWNEGQTTLDNKVYVIPHAESRYANVMVYNKDLLQKAGYTAADLSKQLTFDQFIEIAKKTMAANPGTNGVVFPGKAGWITGLYYGMLSTAGTPEAAPVGTDEGYLFNFKTGTYANNAPGLVDAMGFFKRLKDEGVMHPNSMLFNPADARAPFWDGKAAFILDSSEGIQTYPPNHMDPRFVAMSVPTKDGKPVYRGFQGFAGSGFEVNQKTKHYNEVKIFLNYFIDNFGKIGAASYGPGLPTVNQAQVKTDWEVYNTAMKINSQTYIQIPNPPAKNKYTIDVLTEVSKHLPTTTLGNIFEGYMTGQISDLRDALDKQNAQMNQALTDAIKTVSGSGKAVSQKDFIFSDWTPFQPYNK